MLIHSLSVADECTVQKHHGSCHVWNILDARVLEVSSLVHYLKCGFLASAIVMFVFPGALGEEM